MAVSVVACAVASLLASHGSSWVACSRPASCCSRHDRPLPGVARLPLHCAWARAIYLSTGAFADNMPVLQGSVQVAFNTDMSVALAVVDDFRRRRDRSLVRAAASVAPDGRHPSGARGLHDALAAVVVAADLDRAPSGALRVLAGRGQLPRLYRQTCAWLRPLRRPPPVDDCPHHRWRAVDRRDGPSPRPARRRGPWRGGISPRQSHRASGRAAASA